MLNLEDSVSSPPLGDKLDMWAIGSHPHPALRDLAVNQLLSLANSESEQDRFLAVCNRYLPKAQVVMMQGDESKRVRGVVARILAYEENK